MNHLPFGLFDSGATVTEASEVTLRQFIDSVWFRGLARSMMLLTPILIGGFWIVWGAVAGNQATRIGAVEASIAVVSTTQGARATDAEAFQREVRAAIASINGGLSDVNEELDGVKVDLGVIRRLVIELREQQLADAGPLPLLARPSTVPSRSLALQ